MTLYAIYDRPPAAPAIIAEKFSWAAFVLPPFWAIAHGLWLELLAYIVVVVALSFAGAVIGGSASFWLYVLFAFWIGCSAASLRRNAMRARGWHHRRDLVAAAPDLAAVTWLETAP